ncbi:MAG: YhaI family protein [Fibrobacterales bacterium]
MYSILSWSTILLLLIIGCSNSRKNSDNTLNLDTKSDNLTRMEKSQKRIEVLEFEIEQLTDSLAIDPPRKSYYQSRIREKEAAKENAERSYRLDQIAAEDDAERSYHKGWGHGSVDRDKERPPEPILTK